MTPQQIDRVRESFAKVKPIAPQAAAIFYGKLFELRPGVRPLFKGDMDEQSNKLMATLSVVVANLHDLDSVLPAAEALAGRHVGYGVTAEHYPVVGEALLYTLGAGLGDDFDDETAEAWTAAYGLLSGFMIERAYRVSA
jgi:nitric oxide dioxygenase